ncbi:aminotransferase class V-fold PLP-dependent enzyme, partial [Escherichia coli]|uniref:aminotransferase class V-fold PLP-dependent enzyme n=1 Tax=Escherichia coli TaxID=562 RepID=UPI003855883F|nr:L-seryl-tRNA(Sec) selenium transferase [Escherichia coli]
INENTGLLMKVHTSNYAIQGFTAEVHSDELAALGQEMNLPTAIDLGSGSMTHLATLGLPSEPMPQDYLQQGIDLVTFSGDKLLGGPQAGIILGKKAWIEAIQHPPLKRALRVDKMTVAALDATLRLYQQPEKMAVEIPTLRLLTRT